MDLRQQLEFARDFISGSRGRIRELWNGNSLEVELKEDSSPVTNLDREIEARFREQIARRYPGAGVFGEEFGGENQDAEFLWIIDPIDGTQSLINRVPTFGTFLALLHHGRPVLGIIDLPILDRFVAGAVGQGVLDERGERIVLDSRKAFTSNDIIALGTYRSFERGGDQEIQRNLQSAFPIARAYYDCLGHYFVVQGGVGALVEYNVRWWDIVATEALVSAAGGDVLVIREGNLSTTRSCILGRKSVVDQVRRVLAL